jgi:hypothetical protein
MSLSWGNKGILVVSSRNGVDIEVGEWLLVPFKLNGGCDGSGDFRGSERLRIAIT